MNSFNTFITFVVLVSLTLAFIITPVLDFVKREWKFCIVIGIVGVIYYWSGGIK